MEHFMFFQIEQLMLIRCFEGEALRSKLILREYLNGVTESFQEASFFHKFSCRKSNRRRLDRWLHLRKQISFMIQLFNEWNPSSWKSITLAGS